jgi:hypothetical protein
VTRTDDGGMVTHRGPDGGVFVLNGNDNVYAGNDGNVYRPQRERRMGAVGSGKLGARPSDRIDPSEPNVRRRKTMIMEGPPRRAETPAERKRRRDDEAEHRADSATRHQLERERAARVEATNRSRDFERQRVDRSPRVAPRPSGGRPNVGRGGGRPAGGGGRRGRS